MHDILMLRNVIPVKCLGNVSSKMLEESKTLPLFSKEKIPNSKQFAQSQYVRQIVTGKHFVPSRNGFPCDGFNTTPAVSCHEMKACLVSYIMSVIHLVALPYFSNLLLPCGWQLAAIREQPCCPASPAVGRVAEIPLQSPLLSARCRNPSFHKIRQKVL